MIIKTLVENELSSEELLNEHGLSLYIETKKHKLIFDFGVTTLYADNGAKMGVNIADVDIAFLSHGHYDHGGGLKGFLCKNSQAKVYLHEKAFGEYYANNANRETVYIGLDVSQAHDERLIRVGDNFVIDDELELFSDVSGDKFNPQGNKDLFRRDGDLYVLDEFAHEQNLVIREDGKTLLVAGCAHKGIVNILEHFYKGYGAMPDYVIGGFHLYNRVFQESEAPAVIKEIGEYLIQTKAKYYTCHCTGLKPYESLKALMGEQIDYLSTGMQIII